ncbi:MAG TPA: DUF1579 domain-containing protein [Gemmataceae bacterium]|nr:DUF1579 domain-containing protein [Gemmataceae bacterium]
MKTRTLFVVLNAAGLFWVLSGRELGAGDKKDGDKKPSFEEIMVKLGTPGPNHKLLEPLIGTWNCKVKMYMEPGKPPSESEGTIKRQWILDGRYIHENYAGSFGGKPFKGLGLVGYDNFKKKYTVVWVDSMSTGIMLTTGTYDGKSKTFTYLSSEESDPYFGGKKTKGRDVLRILDADNHVLEMYKQIEGAPEFKMMEISCTRKK